MRDLDDFTTFLGHIAAAYTEEQLEQLSREFDIVAELLLDLYVYRKAPHRTDVAVSREFDIAASPRVPSPPDTPPPNQSPQTNITSQQ
jgi:hypothetical protein